MSTLSVQNIQGVSNLSISGGIAFANGTNVIPAIASASSPNTGIFFPTANTIAFTEGGVEAMRLDANGNVGIGTGSPDTKLNVVDSNATVSRFKTTGSGAWGVVQIINSNTNGEASIGYRDDSDSNNASWVVGKSVGGIDDSFGFYCDGIKMTLSTSGNVGIGTSSALSVFDIAKSGSFRTRVRSTSTASEALTLYQNGTTGSAANQGLLVGIGGDQIGYFLHYDSYPLIIGTNGTERMRISNTGNVSIGTSVTTHKFRVDGTQYWGGDITWPNGTNIYVAGESSFDVQSGGTWGVYDVATSGYFISAAYNGSFSISKDTYLARWRGNLNRAWDNYPSISIDNTTDLGPQTEFRFHGLPGVNGGDYSIVVRSDGGYVTGSDARRKTNVERIDYALDKVLSLTGKSFNVINRDGNLEDTTTLNGRQFGLIAQEIENVVPEVVRFYPEADTPNANGWASAYSVDYPALTALLIEAIKEQQGIINDLKQRIEILET